MKKILILADGIVAKHFLQRISETFISTNEYTIVTIDRSILTEKQPSNFIAYQFDPTSYIKLSKLLKRDYDDIFVIMKNRIDAEGAYQNIRRDRPFARITFFNRWDIEFKDDNLININANELLANRLYDFLPNVPVIAQNVGLGQGEIMEVLVPFGSAYVYRHIGTIIQNQWRIVGLYRGNQLILPKPSLMIKPNDVLLLIGKPSVLESVFKAIKQELGQFPAPFGENIYLYIDMEKESPRCIRNCIEQATYLHKRIKGRKLIIRVSGPTDIRLLETIKALDSHNVECIVDYRGIDPSTLIKEDVETYNIGLVVCGRDIFDDKDYKKIFYSLRKPVLQISDSPLMHLKKLVVILSEEKSMEVISATVFDVASQLNLNIELLDYEPDGDFEKKSFILNHYENLSNIFSKNMNVRQEKRNPIRELVHDEAFLQVLPFTGKILQNRFFAYFSADVEKLYFKLSRNPQLFVPVDIE
ncbi:COG3400 family protein [Hydrogenimonas cancrithermarum]|uniref:Potassium transporter TrkA n=1 Tax=Hydrogenimonas cancrithermarum TaxID=2993563 RepID=A0ABM8FJX4_9BACT|nr:TrkA C-terminal domain-containing protein [Hydrogenimonas cancrithermarum]BDY11946.1 potassium transporter TrkA [Hydrogenimonas cancrithermarum]